MAASVAPVLVVLALAPSCHAVGVSGVSGVGAAVARPETARTPMGFLMAATRAWPTPDAPTRLVVVTPDDADDPDADERVSIYDNALVALVLDRAGRHDEAGRILEALSSLQREDGGIAFSFPLRSAEGAPPYVRTGALAWVGYAAAVYLDVAPGGPARDAIVKMAHRLAAYLAARQIDDPGDPRDGLVTGGEGNFEYDTNGGAVAETFTPGAIEWASIEHNIDAFFFLRLLARVTEQASYADAAERIRRALVDRAWNGEAGQLRRGIPKTGVDAALALDCASWGSLFLDAAGERTRAETAFATADTRFASRDPKTGVAGHRPYAAGPVLEEAPLAAFYESHAKRAVPADWSALQAVWPEGSAGVALAALRLGHPDRASAILAQLERLRGPGGGLPMMTSEVPFEFDTKPAVAAVAWVELVRSELGSHEPFLWRP